MFSWLVEPRACAGLSAVCELQPSTLHSVVSPTGKIDPEVWLSRVTRIVLGCFCQSYLQVGVVMEEEEEDEGDFP